MKKGYIVHRVDYQQHLDTEEMRQLSARDMFPALKNYQPIIKPFPRTNRQQWKGCTWVGAATIQSPGQVTHVTIVLPDIKGVVETETIDSIYWRIWQV